MPSHSHTRRATINQSCTRTVACWECPASWVELRAAEVLMQLHCVTCGKVSPTAGSTSQLESVQQQQQQHQQLQQQQLTTTRAAWTPYAFETQIVEFCQQIAQLAEFARSPVEGKRLTLAAKLTSVSFSFSFLVYNKEALSVPLCFSLNINEIFCVGRTHKLHFNLQRGVAAAALIECVCAILWLHSHNCEMVKEDHRAHKRLKLSKFVASLASGSQTATLPSQSFFSFLFLLVQKWKTSYVADKIFVCWKDCGSFVEFCDVH